MSLNNFLGDRHFPTKPACLSGAGSIYAVKAIADKPNPTAFQMTGKSKCQKSLCCRW